MLKQNDENGDSSRPRTLRLIAARLRDARLILAVSLLGLLLLTSTGSIRPSHALGLGAAIALACAWPRHSATMRLAQQRRRELSDMSWRRAIELPLDAMAEAAYLLRGDGTVKYQNAAAIRLFGRADEDAHLSARIRSPDILGIVQQAGEAGGFDQGKARLISLWAETRRHALELPAGRLHLLFIFACDQHDVLAVAQGVAGRLDHLRPLDRCHRRLDDRVGKLDGMWVVPKRIELFLKPGDARPLGVGVERAYCSHITRGGIAGSRAGLHPTLEKSSPDRPFHRAACAIYLHRRDSKSHSSPGNRI